MGKIAKEATFRALDGLPDGYEFTSLQLRQMVEQRIKQVHLPDTYMRYAREYRVCRRRAIVNVDKARSLYRIGV